ncbi:tetratricopeptide repeat protein [Calycomorphotria hydatis]|uniref:Cellulose synthase subunit BcsC n=1 Tax=Calycomorphotria hydatis TaxID=2528027 RepID=A0A517T559_9PLAN|nr:tetratricopeptide repeat protein [Calycomorphotria hydatis]QDT63516.1 cellulose synthase subunit BcsC [Calycomorphotria hydatis]
MPAADNFRLSIVTTRRALLSFCLLYTLLSAGCNQLNGWAMNESGKAQYNAGNFAAAQSEFQRAAADDPYNVDYAHNLAAATAKLGDLANAESLYRKTLAMDTTHQPSYHGLAEILVKQGRSAEAQQLLQSWAMTDPMSVQPQVELAWLQQETGDYATAEQTLQQVLTKRPNHPYALARLGNLYEQMGQPQRAAALYEQSLSYDWDQPKVINRLAQVKADPPAYAQNFIGPQVVNGQTNKNFSYINPTYIQPQSNQPGPIAQLPSYTGTGNTRQIQYQVPSGSLTADPFRYTQPAPNGPPTQMFGPGLDFGPTVVPFER